MSNKEESSGAGTTIQRRGAAPSAGLTSATPATAAWGPSRAERVTTVATRVGSQSGRAPSACSTPANAGGAARSRLPSSTPNASRSNWARWRSEEHTSELQSHHDVVCRLLLEKKKKI